MLATLPMLDMDVSASAILSHWQRPVAGIHWALPPDNPAYHIDRIEFRSIERHLTTDEQALLWQALINSSTLAYDI